MIKTIRRSRLVSALRQKLVRSQDEQIRIKKGTVVINFTYHFRYWLVRSFYLLYFIRDKVMLANNPIKLSILVPTFNSESNVRKTLDSILNQKTNFRFKIIIADDASTDGTRGVIKEYKEKYPDIIVSILRSENFGLPHNHYHALVENIDTEYWSVLDSDDWYIDHNKLQVQIDILDSNINCAYCSHEIKTLSPDGKEILGERKRKTDSYSKYFYTHTSTKIYRKSVLHWVKRMNNIFVIDDPLARAANLCGKNYFIDEVMSVYDYHGGGVWSGITKESQNERNRMMQNIFYFYNLIPSIRVEDYKPEIQRASFFDVVDLYKIGRN